MVATFFKSFGEDDVPLRRKAAMHSNMVFPDGARQMSHPRGG